MTEQEAERNLRTEGFTHIFAWRDGPHAHYPDHTHARYYSAHIILDGEMTITSEGKTKTVGGGERFDVPANTVHSATMGPSGCRYVIGEK